MVSLDASGKMGATSVSGQYFHFSLLAFLFLVSLIEVARPTPAPMTMTSCPVNHYAVLKGHGTAIESCEVCKRCPPGYGVHEPCTATQNTVCRLCPSGTFSDTISLSEPCHVCRTCDGAGIRQNCSPISNTICNKQCPQGDYYDPSADECRMCSYCFPDHRNARTVRIRSCQSQGLPDDFQCSPLPPADVTENWAPPDAIIVPDRSLPQHEGSDRNLQKSVRGGSHRVLTETTGDIDSDTARDMKGKRNQLGTRTHNDELANPLSLSLGGLGFGDQMTFDSWNQESFDSIFSEFDEDSITGVPKSSELQIDDESWYYISEVDGDDVEPAGDSRHGSQPYESQSYRPLSSADIGLVVGIALGCGVLSFLVTALTCHCCLARRRKSTGPRVSATSGKAPVSAWTYVDLLPAATDDPPVVETPTMSRRVTCV